MTAIQSITPEQQRRGQRDAILASCWGAVSQVMINDSSVMILFATILGAGEMISVCTTSLQYLSLAVLMIPFAYLTEFTGKKRMILWAAAVGAGMLLLTTAASWFGAWSSVVLLGSLAVFAVTITAYLAAWFPLLDGLVPKERRGLFFGHLRFAWQTVAALFIFASSWFVGKQASVGTLQVIIAVAALAMLGRFWYVKDIVEIANPVTLRWKAVWQDILANRALTGFSIYLFFLYMAAYATIPVVFIFAKKHLNLPDNLLVLSSAFVMGGYMAGYLAGGWFVHRHGVKKVFLGAHLSFGLINLLLLSIVSNTWPYVTALVGLITLYSFLLACASPAVSSEMLALAPANNKTMSIAFCYSLFAAGLGGSRFLASLVLGSGLLAPQWTCFGAVLTKYHSLFLVYGCSVIAVSVLLVLVPALTRDVRRLSEV